MCANAGPAEYNYDETLSTLRYANRAKNIKNKPVINEDPKDAMLREYQDEIARLKAQLDGIQVDDKASSQIPDEKEIKKEDFLRDHVHEEKLRQVEERAAREKAEI